MQVNRFLILAAASALFATPFAVCAQSAPPASPAPPAAAAPATLPMSPHLAPNGDIVSTLRASSHFSMLLKAIDATSLSDTLKTTPNLTLFAPTDEAFQALPPSQLAFLMLPANLPTLQKVVIYHLVHLDLDSSKFKGSKGSVASVEASPLALDGSGDPLKVNGADIIQADVHATNGVVHVIDKVLLPPDVKIPAA
jgi:uncharacterized surface protein with fasciclin (FAS1) repeats